MAKGTCGGALPGVVLSVVCGGCWGFVMVHAVTVGTVEVVGVTICVVKSSAELEEVCVRGGGGWWSGCCWWA